MTDRPILFSAPMVRAILAGRKTQTRRIVKGVVNCDTYRGPWIAYDGSLPEGRAWHFGAGRVKGDPDNFYVFASINCPYGMPGDRLWVREAWNVRGLGFGMKPRHAALIAAPNAWRYQADDTTGWQHGWRPSIHMPRAASRITLEITGVRVDRLRDISVDDALAEGIDLAPHHPGMYEAVLADNGRGSRIVCAVDDPTEAYRALWNMINGPGFWDANPWVWVVEFRRVMP